MPDDVRADYDEANSIANASPRGAAALLRLAIQKLCKHLGKPGKIINDDIAALVTDGLPPKVSRPSIPCASSGMKRFIRAK